MMEHTLQRPLLASRNAIGDAFRRSAARYRDKLALVYGDRQWTYRELDAAVNRVAVWLLQQELKPGDRVAALGKNSDLYLLLWLACSCVVPQSRNFRGPLARFRPLWCARPSNRRRGKVASGKAGNGDKQAARQL